jgi:hypothetical protein
MREIVASQAEDEQKQRQTKLHGDGRCPMGDITLSSIPLL